MCFLKSLDGDTVRCAFLSNIVLNGRSDKALANRDIEAANTTGRPALLLVTGTKDSFDQIRGFACPLQST